VQGIYDELCKFEVISFWSFDSFEVTEFIEKYKVQARLRQIAGYRKKFKVPRGPYSN